MTTDKKRHLNNNDRRVKRTKKALRDALFTLLKQKNINQISVTELTNLADINRATFYFYYTDLLDMLQQIQNEAYLAFKEILTECNSSIFTVEGFTEYVEQLLVFCQEQETLCRFVINNDTNNQLFKQVQLLMLDNIPDAKIIYGEDHPMRYATKYILSAIIGTIIDWMDEGMKIPPHDLAELFANLYLKGSGNTKKFYSNKFQKEKSADNS